MLLYTGLWIVGLDTWKMKQYGCIIPMCEHRYKYGKQKTIMTVEEFRDELKASQIKFEQKAFLVLLWHSEREKARCTKESKMT